MADRKSHHRIVGLAPHPRTQVQPLKPKSSLPDGIHIAWAGVEVNERIEKTVPTYPDAWEQLYKVANYKYKFSADGLKQYWSIDLDKPSREVTAFWTPRGLYQFIRLVMGTKNVVTVTQNAYLHTRAQLSPQARFPRPHRQLR